MQTIEAMMRASIGRVSAAANPRGWQQRRKPYFSANAVSETAPLRTSARSASVSGIKPFSAR